MFFRFLLIISFITSCSNDRVVIQKQNKLHENSYLLNNNKKVALFVHGLNQRPDKMKDLMNVFHKTGYDCYLIQLKGHGSNFNDNLKKDIADSKLDAFKNAKFNDWLDDFGNVYQKIKNNYSEFVVVGYSLGGLVSLNYLEINKVKVDKIFLIAPSIAIHSLNYSVKFLSFFPTLVIPSLAPQTYRENKGTPVRAYLSLYKGIEKFEKLSTDYINTKSLIILNEDDELVSYEKTKKIIKEKRLNNWKVVKISKKNVEKDLDYEHLIIDSKSLGDSWEIIKNYIHTF